MWLKGFPEVGILGEGHYLCLSPAVHPPGLTGTVMSIVIGEAISAVISLR